MAYEAVQLRFISGWFEEVNPLFLVLNKKRGGSSAYSANRVKAGFFNAVFLAKAIKLVSNE